MRKLVIPARSETRKRAEVLFRDSPVDATEFAIDASNDVDSATVDFAIARRDRQGLLDMECA